MLLIFPDKFNLILDSIEDVKFMTQKTKEDSGVVTLEKTTTREPSLYQVLLLNDDYTTMEFVVHILKKYFHKSDSEATTVMLHVHQKGQGVCGVYPYDIAATKISQVSDEARQNNMPLKCIMEKQ